MTPDSPLPFEDWDPEVPRCWRDHLDWLAPRRWLRRPRIQIRNGYKCQFDYSTGRWQFTHRLVAEAALGRPIPPGYEVHHINGDKLDNRPENLAVLPRELHRAIHDAARAAAQSGRSYVKALLDAFERLGGASADLLGAGDVQEEPNRDDTRVQGPPPSSRDMGAVSAMSAALLSSALLGRAAGGPSGCPRCGGSGYLPQFSHVEGGICFLCGGGGEYYGDNGDDDEPLDEPLDRLNDDDFDDYDSFLGPPDWDDGY